MTLEEVAQILGRKPSTIYNNWERTQSTLRKKGIILTRWGRGKNIEYELEWEEVEDEDEE